MESLEIQICIVFRAIRRNYSRNDRILVFQRYFSRNIHKRTNFRVRIVFRTMLELFEANFQLWHANASDCNSKCDYNFKAAFEEREGRRGGREGVGISANCAITHYFPVVSKQFCSRPSHGARAHLILTPHELEHGHPLVYYCCSEDGPRSSLQREEICSYFVAFRMNNYSLSIYIYTI